MKKIFWCMLVCCSAWLTGCKEAENDTDSNLPGTDQSVEIFDGIYVNNTPSKQPSIMKVYPIGQSSDGFGVSETSAKSAKTILPNDDGARGYDYRFMQVGEYPTLTVKNTQGKDVEVQASHVKITDDAKYAFVSYNAKYDEHIGGIRIFNVSDIERPHVEAELDMNDAELSAIDYDPVKSVLYATGATVSQSFGYRGDANLAFVMSVALDNEMKIKEEAPSLKMLTSYQGTSIKLANGGVYVTTGDGTQGTKGGLYLLNEELTDVLAFVEADNARSIDVDEQGDLYLMQAEYARITKFDPQINSPLSIYSATGEAMQHHAKSEIAVLASASQSGYVLAAENESGVRMIDVNDGSVVAKLIWPEGSDPEDHVTNSVTINCDTKSYVTEGVYFQSNLLLLANGGKGLYWYDIKDGKILSCNANSINFGDRYSANFVASRGNIVFVADGLGGLKILAITVDNGKPEPEPEPETACTEAYESFYSPENTASLFPETKSVFSSNAAGPVKTIFSAADVDKVMKSIKVTNKTNLYISYMHEGAGYKNALAFYVTPSGQNTFEYFQNNVNKEGKLYTTKNGLKVINNEYLILPNISDKSEGGPLSKGEMFRMINYATEDGSFNAGDEVVLVLIQDGWNAQNKYVQMQRSPVVLNFDVLRGLLPTNSTQYSSNNTTGEPYNTFKGIQHCAFYTGDCNTIVVAFEDEYSGSDVDYNDIIFTVTDKSDGTGGGVMNIEKPYFTMNPDGNLVPTNP